MQAERLREIPAWLIDVSGFSYNKLYFKFFFFLLLHGKPILIQMKCVFVL